MRPYGVHAGLESWAATWSRTLFSFSLIIKPGDLQLPDPSRVQDPGAKVSLPHPAPCAPRLHPALHTSSAAQAPPEPREGKRAAPVDSEAWGNRKSRRKLRRQKGVSSEISPLE